MVESTFAVADGFDAKLEKAYESADPKAAKDAMEILRGMSRANNTIALCGISSLSTQVQSTEVSVPPSPEEYVIQGTIYPQFWKVTLKDQLLFVPLQKVAAFGIQDYEAVRETVISDR